MRGDFDSWGGGGGVCLLYKERRYDLIGGLRNTGIDDVAYVLTLAARN